jgi:hypothetical protein
MGQARTDRLHVSIEGLGEWDAEPSVVRHREIEQYIADARARSALEQRVYPEPVPWFVAFLEPHVDDLNDLADAANRLPALISARAHHQVHRGRTERWLITTVLARSDTDASRTVNDALVELIWPNERIAQAVPRAGLVTIGQHEVSGLAQFERDDFD